MATTRRRINEKRNSTTETTNVRRRIQNSSSLRRNSSASAPNAGKKIRIERRCPLSSISVPLRRAPDAESARTQCPARRERRPPPRPHNFSCCPTARGEPCRQPPPLRPPLRSRLRQSLRRPNLPKHIAREPDQRSHHCGRIQFIYVILVVKQLVHAFRGPALCLLRIHPP